jgi:Fe-Mn family superoxide dismutase
MSHASRRDFLKTSAVSVAASAVLTTAVPAGEKKTVQLNKAFEYQHAPKPLPFDAKSLKGLSERLIQSHWENNYAGAVKALNTVRSRLSQALADANTPPYVYNGLKREQLIRTGSVVLHELYFANLGGSAAAPGNLRSRLAQSFGSYDAWETEFRKIGTGLGGGSGWVMLAYNPRLGVLENHWMADHSTAPAEGVPVLLMDMYEHSYQMEYGAAAARYIDAFFANIQWDVVEMRMSP